MKINKENIVLNLPSMDVFASYLEALEEGFYRGMGPVKTKDEIEEIIGNASTYLESLNAKSLGKFKAPSGEEFDRVPYETLWVMEGEKFIGEVSFRHELNKFLEDFGGHVGYGIRPSLSGQGYATLALKLTLQRAKIMGMEKLMVSCSPDNPASERVIVKNGGEFIDVSKNTHGYDMICYRYWVPTI